MTQKVAGIDLEISCLSQYQLYESCSKVGSNKNLFMAFLNGRMRKKCAIDQSTFELTDGPRSFGGRDASVWTEMSKEIKFALACDASSKPVRKKLPERENGPSYLSINNTFGSTFTTSQYSFSSKDPAS
ncbi:hypothetical protein GWK47_021721 [Chionoecetes opilio]|uniref:Uncharacterized protein n=1 Tax=Chionoecetes opilio TaxID=41210 RepID=A0A8J4XNH8_CHIOP|nr:hypothetical protein GWK47_021721 [Chionoecetes opilio]